jgi:hypothetical protein
VCCSTAADREVATEGLDSIIKELSLRDIQDIHIKKNLGPVDVITGANVKKYFIKIANTIIVRKN